ARLSRREDAARAAQRGQAPDVLRCRRLDGRPYPRRRGAVLRRARRVPPYGVFLLPQLPLRGRVEGQPPPAFAGDPHLRRAAQIRPGLQGDLRRRRLDEPLRDRQPRRLGRALERGAGQRLAFAGARPVAQRGVAQSRARRALGLHPLDPDDPRAVLRADVSADLGGAGGGDARAFAQALRPAARGRPVTGIERRRAATYIDGSSFPEAAMDTKTFPVTFSEAEWQARLTPEQYHVMREHGTERPGSCALLHEKRAGSFACAGCGQELFRSSLKFESGTGWPSFND